MRIDTMNKIPVTLNFSGHFSVVVVVVATATKCNYILIYKCVYFRYFFEFKKRIHRRQCECMVRFWILKAHSWPLFPCDKMYFFFLSSSSAVSDLPMGKQRAECINWNCIRLNLLSAVIFMILFDQIKCHFSLIFDCIYFIFIRHSSLIYEVQFNKIEIRFSDTKFKTEK